MLHGKKQTREEEKEKCNYKQVAQKKNPFKIMIFDQRFGKRQKAREKQSRCQQTTARVQLGPQHLFVCPKR